MRTHDLPTKLTFSCVLALLGPLAHAQDADAVLGTPNGWQRYDWLSPSTSAAGPGGKLSASASENTGDPFTLVNSDGLWQQKYGVTYTRPLAPDLTLLYETDAVTLNESSESLPGPIEGTPDDLSHDQKAGLQLQPVQQVTLCGNLHDSSDDAASPATSTETRGGGLTAESHLPFNSVLNLGANMNTTATGGVEKNAVSDNSCDAQIKQPLGKLPLTAVMKGHYEETSQDGAATAKLPSLEQSLILKLADSSTVQMGLRQQKYQSFPGITNDLNETIFADWSQNLLPEVTWHSYAEVLSSRGTQDVAPAVPIASGANGTAQSADPTNTMALPNSFSDETVTFSTGPSFKLDRDVSARVEYSNRIDRNPLPGDVGQEQRVSVSLKGTF